MVLEHLARTFSYAFLEYLFFLSVYYPSLSGFFYANSRQAVNDGHAYYANGQDNENEVGVRRIAYVYAGNRSREVETQVVRNVARRTAKEAVLLVAELGGAGTSASSVVMCVRQGE